MQPRSVVDQIPADNDGIAIAEISPFLVQQSIRERARHFVEYEPMPTSLTEGQGRSTGLVDVLDRVLDKGLVVAGDIKVSLAEVELLTIRIRLLICSIDKAEQIGLDWWKYDHHLSPGKQALSAENDELRKQVRALERQLASLTRRRSAPAAEVYARARRPKFDTRSVRCPLNEPQAAQVLSTFSIESSTRES